MWVGKYPDALRPIRFVRGLLEQALGRSGAGTDQRRFGDELQRMRPVSEALSERRRDLLLLVEPVVAREGLDGPFELRRGDPACQRDRAHDTNNEEIGS